MKHLYLEDLSGLAQDEVKQHIACNYEYPLEKLENYDILVAYESVGSWGCDSSSWFLIKDKTTGELYETHGSHCSCYGFEGQFEPEHTTVEYLQSDKFYFCCGGYDDNEESNYQAVKEYLRGLGEV